MNILKKSILLVICFTVLISSFAMISYSQNTSVIETGIVYYVSTAGDDGNDGLSESAAFRTINFAGKKLMAGDTLYIMGGTYIEDQLTITTSGTVDKPITVAAYEGQTPIIDMQNSKAYEGAGIFFNLYTNNIVIDGLTINNTRGGSRAVDLITSPIVDDIFHTNIKIINCNIYNCNDGISLFGSQDILISNNYFEECGGNLVKIEGVQDGAGAGDFIILYNTQRVLIENNYFTKAGHYIMYASGWYDAYGKLLTSYDTVIRNNVMNQHWGGGIGIICGAYNTLVENNLITYSGVALLNYPKTGLQVAGDNNIIRNNLFAKAATNKGVDQNFPGDPGFSLQSYTYKIYAQSCENNRIYNNNIYKNGREGLRISQRDGEAVANNKVINNIMYKNREGGSETLNWLKGDLKTLPLWFSIQVEAMTTAADAAWKTGTNGNLFYNNVLMPFANGENAPGYDKFMWIGLKYTDVFYSVEGLNNQYPTSIFNNLEVDPMFVNEDDEDFSKTDFNLKEDSPCIDAGAHLAKTTEAGVNTTQVKVDDSLFFCDGYGVIDGDMVQIGENNPVRILSVDNDNNILTLTEPISYELGDYVDLPYQGNAPDMGMYESPYEATPTPTPLATPAFPDVNPDNFGWAQEAVEYLAELDIINGIYVDEQLVYLPHGEITRAQLCKLIVVAYGLVQDGTAKEFTDVGEHWAKDNIEVASSLQIVKGYEDDTFKPDTQISRQELAVMVSRAMNYKNVGIEIADNEVEQNLAIFLDQEMIDLWARKEVAFAVLNGIIMGSPVEGGFNFYPLNTANRAEAAVMIKRAYDKLG